MKMTIPYNITGKQRKQLAEDIIIQRLAYVDEG